MEDIGKMKKEDFALGIDLGGTKIYAVITNADHQILAEAKTETDNGACPEKIAADIVNLGAVAAEQMGIELKEIPHIGVALPAPVDPLTGDCLTATNLGWRNFSIKESFYQLLGREVYLNNDGNLGTLGEYTCGSAKGFDTVIGYYVGTGLGGGIICNGRLHCGNSGLAGEFGHAIIKKGGRRCGCGHRGCVEAYCSKVAFVKALKKEIFKKGQETLLPADKFNINSKNIKSKHLAKAYRGGDVAVRRVIQDGAYMLGIAAASASAVIAPNCIVLGGGVIEALGTEMYPFFKRGFDSHLFSLEPEKVNICFGRLGDSAVAVGATVYARNKGNM